MARSGSSSARFFMLQISGNFKTCVYSAGFVEILGRKRILRSELICDIPYIYAKGDACMQIKTQRDGETLAVLLTGELDHHSAAPLRVELDALLGDRTIRCLALDLCGVTFMDSSGLGVVLGRYKLMKERGGSVRIQGASRPVERILKMAGVYALLGQQDAERGKGHV